MMLHFDAGRASRGRAGRAAILLLVLVSASSPLLAKGNREAPTDSADGKENWQHAFDISDKGAGKFNVYVEATDLAGNKAVAGPFNFLIDPKSDLPVVRVLNPTPRMRVGGDLTIVGSCADDDGVAKVELSVDGGPFVEAEGTELWSLYLKTAGIPDGKRSLSVRATDIHGLLGKETRLVFNLDRSKPVVEVSSPAPGALVAGAARLQGEARDANGLASLEVSLDAGAKYSKVDLKRGRELEKASFVVPLDTRKLGDGPKVIWFRCADGAGSTSTTAYLLVVDNTKPAIDVVRPQPGQAINGIFTVAGSVRDAVGIKRLSYEFAGIQKGEIPLRPGDPYFAVALDAGPLKAATAPLILLVEDRIGNVTKFSIAPRIDREADKPTVAVAFPAPEGRLRASEQVWGSISDDDGVASLRWSIDGGPPVETAASESFALSLPELASGRHLLAMTAIDSNGLAGNQKVLPFLFDGGRGLVSIRRLSLQGQAKAAAASRDFFPGVEVKVDGGEVLEGSVSMPNPPVRAEWRIADGEPRKLELLAGEKAAKDSRGGTWSFRIPMDRSLPYGFAPLSVRVQDGFGNEALGEALVYVTNYAIAREQTGFQFEEGRAADGGLIRLAANEPLMGAFFREKLASLSLDPPTNLVRASYSGSTVSISAVGVGRSEATRLIGKTEAGHEFTAGPFVFLTDLEAPDLAIESPAQGLWVRDGLRISGSARDQGGLAGLSWRLLPGGKSVDIKPGPEGRFSLALGVSELSGLSGRLTLEIEARDEAGNAARAYLSFGLSSEEPKLSFLCPENGAEVWGPEDIAASVSAASGIASVEYSEDGQSYAAVETAGGYFVHRADLATHPLAVYRVTDRAGNAVLARPALRIVPVPSIAGAGDSVEVEARAGEGRVELVGQAGSRKLAVRLPSLAEAAAEAPGGPSDSRLLVSLPISLKGKAWGPESSPVSAVSLSLDGGSSFQSLATTKDQKTAQAGLPFSLSIDPSKLKGESRLILKLEGFDGGARYATLFLGLDQAAPAISLLSPGQGQSSYPGALPLVLKIEDARGTASAELALGSERSALPVSEGGRYFARILDPSSVAKGGPITAVASARDAAGNASSTTIRLGFDAAGDLPRLELALAPDRYLAAGSLISCEARDDDGPAVLALSIDGKETARSEAGAIALALPSLAPGKHLLSLSVRDSGGRTAELKKEILALGPAPSIGQVELGDQKLRTPWTPALPLAFGQGSLLAFSVEAPNGLASVECRLGDRLLPAIAGKAGASGAPLPFTVALPQQAYGLASLVVRAKDAAGSSVSRSFLVLSALPAAGGTDDDDGLRFADTRIAREGASSTLVLTPSEPLVGRFKGRDISSVSLSPATDLVEASFDGSAVSLRARAEGATRPTTVQVLTIDGDRFEWGPAVFKIDAGPPSLELSGPIEGQWVKDSLKVAGIARDPLGLGFVGYSIDGGEVKELPRASSAPSPPAIAGAAPKEEIGSRSKSRRLTEMDLAPSPPPPAASPPPTDPREFPFDQEISLGESDGAHRLVLIARDLSGREAFAARLFSKDSEAPVLTQVLPAPGEAVNGLFTFIGEARDAGRLSTISFALPKDDKAPAPAGAEAEAEARAKAVEGLASFTKSLDANLTAFPLPEGAGFIATDRSGNQAILAPDLAVDSQADLPVADIHAPLEDEVLRQDFVVSGVAFDDDGVAALSYSLDGGEWTRIALEGQSFSLPLGLLATGDNEHEIKVKAEDVYGIAGEVASRTFRISTEEPFALLVSPPSTKVLAGIVDLRGRATDANGVKAMALSFDSSASFQAPSGSGEWNYRFDTRLLDDGARAIALRPVDGFGTVGFTAALLTVDNSPPEVALDLPADGFEAARELLVSGRVSDKLGLESARIEILPARQLESAMTTEIGTGRVVRTSLDISGLAPGIYTVRLVARDRAGNESLATRDIRATGGTPADSVEILYPLPGSAIAGQLRLSGKAKVAGGATDIEVLLDGKTAANGAPGAQGYFNLDIDPALLTEGSHRLSVIAKAPDGRAILSPERELDMKRLGPWVRIESLKTGDFVPYRPYLRGRAGMLFDPPDPSDQKALAAFRKTAKERAVSLVELSLDGGLSYHKAEGTAAWRFRLETPEYREGQIHVVVRAQFGDGSSASDATILYLDKDPPQVEMLSPREGELQNQRILVIGSASDSSGIASVGLALRKGDKKAYELPAFIQGLYVDGHFLGATTWEAGLGLSFFDDNVKLQGELGSAPAVDSSGQDQSFYGTVFGAKLIANLAYLPFNYFFGPDWDFLSLAFGLGANFTYFSQTQSGSGLLVGAVFAQFEFPKVTMRNWETFKKFSLYSEIQVWVLSSVVSGGFIPKLSFGVRLGLF